MFANYKLADPQVNAKGGRYCPLSDGDKPAWILPSGKLYSPFGGPSTYEAAVYTPRQTLELRCDEELAATIRAFDEWAKTYILEHSERLFKKKLTPQQIQEGYRSPMHQKGDYAPNLRTKIDLEGRMACRYWTPEGICQGPPDDYKMCEIRVRLLIRSMWFMQKEFGFTLQVMDMQVHTRSHVCPFIPTTGESDPFSKQHYCHDDDSIEEEAS